VKHLLFLLAGLFFTACTEREASFSETISEKEAYAIASLVGLPVIPLDISMSMEMVYQTIPMYTGNDSCIGARHYLVKTPIGVGDSLVVSALIGKQFCVCCPSNPPGIPRFVTLDLALSDRDEFYVEGELTDTTYLTDRILKWSVYWHNVEARFLKYRVSWAAESKLTNREILINKAIRAFLQTKEIKCSWVGSNSYSPEGYPWFLLVIEEEISPLG
jgi:hypothetical protein